jgi:hypothetical protein
MTGVYGKLSFYRNSLEELPQKPPHPASVLTDLAALSREGERADAEGGRVRGLCGLAGKS